MLDHFAVRWVAAAFLLTALAAGAFLVGQNQLRGGANSPQLQMADDAARKLQAGVSPDHVLPAGVADMTRSPAPWLIVFGPDRRPIAGTARLNGFLPDYPPSVFDNAPAGGKRDVITWQPRPGVRAATVAVGFRGGWVVAGRSLRATEQQETQLTVLLGGAWAGSLVLAAVIIGAPELVRRRLAAR